MAAFEIKAPDTRRPCLVEGIGGRDKALFHMWVERSWYEPMDTNMLRKPAGWMRDIYALVEYGDGSVQTVVPERIRFADGGGFDDYAWPEDEERV